MRAFREVRLAFFLTAKKPRRPQRSGRFVRRWNVILRIFYSQRTTKYGNGESAIMISKIVQVSKGGTVVSSHCNISKITPEEVKIITDALAFQQDHKETFDGSKWNPNGRRERLLMNFIEINDAIKAGYADGRQ